MFAFTVIATATGLPSWNTSVPIGGGTVTTVIFGGGGSVIGGSGIGVVVVVVNGGVVVVVVGADGVLGVVVVVVGVVAVGDDGVDGVDGVDGAAGGSAVWTETGSEIRVARGCAATGPCDRTTACCGRAVVGRAWRATRCGTATGLASVVATTTCAPLDAGVASSPATASSAPT